MFSLVHDTDGDQDIQPSEPNETYGAPDHTGHPDYVHEATCPVPPADSSTGGHGGVQQPLTPMTDTSARLGTARSHHGRGLHGAVVHHLGQLVVSGQLGVERPLVLDEITGRFGISRTVVRESLRVLECKGLIRARPNVGTWVRPVSDWNLLDPDVIEWRSASSERDGQFRELRELRWMTETTAARLSSHRHLPSWPDDQAALLRRIVRRMGYALRDGAPTAFARADQDFHDLLIEASGNLMLHHLHTITSACLAAPETPTGCTSSRSSLASHDAVADAVLNHDADAAEEAMRDLLSVPFQEQVQSLDGVSTLFAPSEPL